MRNPDVEIRVLSPEGHLDVIREAIENRQSQDGWELGEHELAKRIASEAYAALRRQTLANDSAALWRLKLASWKVLQGELARLLWARDCLPALDLFRIIRQGLRRHLASRHLEELIALEAEAACPPRAIIGICEGTVPRPATEAAPPDWDGYDC
jgi:hypothetical protein